MLKPIFVGHVDKSFSKFDPLEIACIGVERNYTKFIYKDKTYESIRTTLKKVLEGIPLNIFIQINRSWIVSVYFIDRIVDKHVIIGDFVLPVSPEFYDRLIQQLQIINWDESEAPKKQRKKRRPKK